MKKLPIIFFSILLLTSCVDSLQDWNVDQKNASNVPARTFFTGAVKNLTDILTDANVNRNNYRMFVQYMATTTYINEPRYNMTARLYSQLFWQAHYRDVISDLKTCKSIVAADALLSPGVKNNQLALVEIMEIYSWYALVNTFGDVPYTEAFNPEKPLAKYDDAQTVYNDLLDRLDAALAILTPSEENFGTADLLYSGSTPNWVKFGNSLKLRMGMIIADVNNAKAKTVIESAAASLTNVFSSNEDNASFQYLAAQPNNNPISNSLHPSLTAREDFVVASAIVDAMNTRNDPRRQFYFTNVGGVYIGGDYGFENDYVSFSHIGDMIIEPTFEALLMDYSEVEFLLAEAIERGYAVPGNAEGHYNAAITASILYWGGTAANATAYLAQPEVTYTTAAGDYKQKIGTQKWIALYNRGWDAWVEWRRLDYPVLLPPSGASIPDPLTIPRRMIFPVSEQTENGTAWKAAAGKYKDGSVEDSPKAKLFWDVN